jgi:hypothetical protein
MTTDAQGTWPFPARVGGVASSACEWRNRWIEDERCLDGVIHSNSSHCDGMLFGGNSFILFGDILGDKRLSMVFF